MNAISQLTPREREIAELLAWGAAKKEVADHLNISESTVANTARSIYSKLNIQKATELSVWFFCTRFRISFDMSPLKKAIMACILVIAMIPEDLLFIRSARSARRNTCEQRHLRRRKEDVNDLNMINYLT